MARLELDGWCMGRPGVSGVAGAGAGAGGRVAARDAGAHDTHSAQTGTQRTRTGGCLGTVSRYKPEPQHSERMVRLDAGQHTDAHDRHEYTTRHTAPLTDS
eukprot:4324977-Prymnesium_polylepis.2